MSKVIELSMHDDKIDLLIERDSGNKMLILMGKPEYSLPSWRKLRRLCDKAIKQLT